VQYPLLEVELARQSQVAIAVPVGGVHASPSCLLLVALVFVQKPMSVWQT